MLLRFFSFLVLFTLAALSKNADASSCEELLAKLKSADLIIAAGQKIDVEGVVQSRFIGPTSLKIWKHWQQSWNVESLSDNQFQFELIRAMGNDSRPYVLLRVRGETPALAASIQSETFERTSQWAVEKKTSNAAVAQGKVINGWTEFEFRDAEAFYDRNEQRTVTRISFSVTAGNQQVLSYNLEPMYVRGARNSYWNNAIDPYSAHAGAGAIKVATATDTSIGWSQWGGTLVKPSLTFIERNTTPLATVGLHRHEMNQELYFAEQGAFVAVHGVAQRSSDPYQVKRKWDSNGTVQETTEFQASGGWMESRHLLPGDVFIVVPNPSNAATVYHHGIRGLSDESVFWTMGTKN